MGRAQGQSNATSNVIDVFAGAMRRNTGATKPAGKPAKQSRKKKPLTPAPAPARSTSSLDAAFAAAGVPSSGLGLQQQDLILLRYAAKEGDLRELASLLTHADPGLREDAASALTTSLQERSGVPLKTLEILLAAADDQELPDDFHAALNEALRFNADKIDASKNGRGERVLRQIMAAYPLYSEALHEVLDDVDEEKFTAWLQAWPADPRVTEACLQCVNPNIIGENKLPAKSVLKAWRDTLAARIPDNFQYRKDAWAAVHAAFYAGKRMDETLAASLLANPPSAHDVEADLGKAANMDFGVFLDRRYAPDTDGKKTPVVREHILRAAAAHAAAVMPYRDKLGSHKLRSPERLAEVFAYTDPSFHAHPEMQALANALADNETREYQNLFANYRLGREKSLEQRPLGGGTLAQTLSQQFAQTAKPVFTQALTESARLRQQGNLVNNYPREIAYRQLREPLLDVLAQQCAAQGGRDSITAFLGEEETARFHRKHEQRFLREDRRTETELNAADWRDLVATTVPDSWNNPLVTFADALTDNPLYCNPRGRVYTGPEAIQQRARYFEFVVEAARKRNEN